MARAQQQGVSAVTVWMIVFAGLWLAATVFLIVMYTGQEEIKIANDRLKRDNRQLVSNSERSSIALIKNLVEGGATAVGLLESARAETAMLAVNDADAQVASVRSQRDLLVDDIQADSLVDDPGQYADVSLLEGMQMLYDAFKAENESRRKLEGQVADLGRQVGELEQRAGEQKDSFDAKLADLSSEQQTEREEHAAYRTSRDQSLADLEAEFNTSRSENDSDLTNERKRRAGAEERMAHLKQRLTALQEKFGEVMIGPDELSTAREPDGKVLMAVAGDEVVYIDLGGSNALTLGMRFGVYSPETGIPADGRAKGHIEVVSILPESAECKIVGVAGHNVILEGDLIANPLYDPNRPMTFLVLGRFDLDRDGQLDVDGAAAVTSMVRDWGGDVVSVLSPLTDFVILGAPPRQPRPADQVSSDEVSRNERLQQAWDGYAHMASAAKDLAVPVMTQDVFLNFLGYAGRYARR